MKGEFLRLLKRVMNSPLARCLQDVVTVTFLLIFFLPTRAEAYLDPGTGSLIIQLVLGGIAGLVTIFKLYRERIKNFLNRLKTKTDSSDI